VEFVKTAAWRWILVAGALVTGVYFTVSGDLAKDIVYTGVGLSSVVCMMIGIRMHRPARRTAWLAMAASNLCFVGGDAILSYYDIVLHRETPFPGISDASYLMGYPFLVLAVLQLTRSNGRRSGREDRVDAAIMTIGALALLWQVLMGTYAHDATTSVFGRAVTMAYPIMDIGVLFIVLSAVLATSQKGSAIRLVALGLSAMLIADFGYDLLVLHGLYYTGHVIDAGWIISYTLLGAAALHPSMSVPFAAATQATETRRRLPTVALAGFVAPAVFLVASMTGSSVDVPVLASTSVVLFALVILRVTWLLTRMHNQTVALREQSEHLGEALAAQRLLEDDLRHQAFHDHLTGLANRALLHDRVAHALSALARSPGTLALLFCDLDGFKTINDSLGHHVGDELLVAVGSRLASIVRPGDTVARLGGDEFAILMANVNDPADALTMADRVISVLRRPIKVGDRWITISASVGVSFSTDSKTVERLLSEADVAMYEAKSRGKDRFELFEEAMRTSIVHQMDLRNSFADGLRRGEFFLQYQPTISLHNGELEGFEALVRWRHPVHGELGPAEFIFLAEETGFVLPLGRWVVETACNTAAAWQRSYGRALTISVNVSGRQLQNSQFVDDVGAALAYSGIDPGRLVLEVTESTLMVDPAHVAKVLAQMKALGVLVAIDDFGTGYSSLSQLRQFPIDIIKIDKTFVDTLADDGKETDAFVATIIRLAHQLQLSTTAEGIEDDAQLRTLTRLGCDSAQGYLISRPLDVDAAHRLATANQVPDREARTRSA
jgi:diguanylate cyclase